MDIMKKFGLFLIAAIAVTAFTSCNDDDGGDTQGYTDGYYVSFDLTPLAERLEGKKGVVLHIETNKNGPQEIKLDLLQKK